MSASNIIIPHLEQHQILSCGKLIFLSTRTNLQSYLQFGIGPFVGPITPDTALKEMTFHFQAF